MSNDNRISLEDMERNINQLPGIGFEEDNITAMLQQNEGSMVRHIFDTLREQYRRTYTHCEVPDAAVWDYLEHMAYDIYIRLFKARLKDLAVAREAVQKKINKRNPA